MDVVLSNAMLLCVEYMTVVYTTTYVAVDPLE